MTTDTSRVLVVVDGSNVVHAPAWRDASTHSDSDLGMAQRELVDAIASWAARAGHDAHVVFDGVGPGMRSSPRVIIESSGRDGADADALVERAAVASITAGRSTWLVTADGNVRAACGPRIERNILPQELIAELLAPAGEVDIDAPPEDDQPSTMLRETLDPDVFRRLNRLRGVDDD